MGWECARRMAVQPRHLLLARSKAQAAATEAADGRTGPGFAGGKRSGGMGGWKRTVGQLRRRGQKETGVRENFSE
jgi:hypothetical protein